MNEAKVSHRGLPSSVLAWPCMCSHALSLEAGQEAGYLLLLDRCRWLQPLVRKAAFSCWSRNRLWHDRTEAWQVSPEADRGSGSQVLSCHPWGQSPLGCIAMVTYFSPTRLAPRHPEAVLS